MGTILDLIAEIPTNAVLREKVALLLAKNAALLTEKADLAAENQELRQQIEPLQNVIREQANFQEHRGVLFRRLPAGGFEDTVYCPECRSPMTSLMGYTEFSCRKCHREAGFKPDRLSKIILELESLKPKINS